LSARAVFVSLIVLEIDPTHRPGVLVAVTGLPRRRSGWGWRMWWSMDFVIYPAGTFPNQKEEIKDNTHFNSNGAYELAKWRLGHSSRGSWPRDQMPAYQE